jgi:hypothetical protein
MSDSVPIEYISIPPPPERPDPSPAERERLRRADEVRERALIASMFKGDETLFATARDRFDLGRCRVRQAVMLVGAGVAVDNVYSKARVVAWVADLTALAHALKK